MFPEGMNMNTRLPSSVDGVHTYALPTRKDMGTHEGAQPSCITCIVVRDTPRPGENWVEIDEVPPDKKRRKPHV